MSVRITRLNASPALYSDVLLLQDFLFERKKRDAAGLQSGPRGQGSSATEPDYVLTLQHAHTYTVGKRGSERDFKLGNIRDLESRLNGAAKTVVGSGDVSGVEIVQVPRGGQTTYHGPGQIVVYPIVSLRRIGMGARAYVESLEDAMIDTAAEYGIEAQGRIPGKTGVWVGDRKIGAIGVAISGGDEAWIGI